MMAVKEVASYLKTNKKKSDGGAWKARKGVNRTVVS